MLEEMTKRKSHFLFENLTNFFLAGTPILHSALHLEDMGRREDQNAGAGMGQKKRIFFQIAFVAFVPLVLRT